MKGTIYGSVFQTIAELVGQQASWIQNTRFLIWTPRFLIWTHVPRFILKSNQGIVLYEKHWHQQMIGRKKVTFNRMIVSLRLDNNDSCLA